MVPAIQVEGDAPRVELFLCTDRDADPNASILEPAWDADAAQLRDLPPPEKPSDFIRRLLGFVD